MNNLRKIENSDKFRKCVKCGKTYLLEKGFYSSGNGYYNVCKKCRAERYRKKENFKNHSYIFIEGIEVCKRCGIIRKKVAVVNKKNSWIAKYLVNGKWQLEHPDCIK